ncbi:MAG: DUF748 domain-containing protein [Candidatus Omnitrophica bacterium]|nr:DUF748 domain-containing protein [Candidatus Omnitrophota bacterium]
MKLIKIIFKFFVGIIILIIGGYTFLYFFINERGKDIFLKFVKEQYGIQAKLDSLNMRFPLRIIFTNFQMDNINFREATVDIGKINLLEGALKIDKIYVKELNIEIDMDKLEQVINNKPLGSKSLVVVKQSFLPQVWRVKIDVFVLDNGSIIFRYNNLSPNLTFGLKNISGTIEDINYPLLDKFSLDLKGSIIFNEKNINDDLHIEGWIDWRKKNMDTFITTGGIDYFVFKDYYPNFWKPENLELKEALISLKAHLRSKDDDLRIGYTLILEKVVFNDKPFDESKVKTIKTILKLFKGNNDKPAIHLTFNTKMSLPHFEVSSIGESMLEQLQNLGKIPTPNIFNEMLNKTEVVIDDSIKGIKGLTIDPALSALKDAVNRFLENIRKIAEIGSKKNDSKGE